MQIAVIFGIEELAYLINAIQIRTEEQLKLNFKEASISSSGI